MVPKALLFITTQTTGMFSSRAVARSAGFWPKPPSPTIEITILAGVGELGAQRRGRTEAHGGEAARRQDAARRIDRELLADAVLVPADVGGQIGVARHRRRGCRRECAPASSERRRWSPPCRWQPTKRARSLRDRRDEGLVPARASDTGARPPSVIAFSACLTSATTPISVGKLRPISCGSISMWISLEGGKLKVKSGYQDEQSASLKRVPEAQHPIGFEALAVVELRAPEARHAERQRMVVRQRALAHQACGRRGSPCASTNAFSSAAALARTTPPPT